MPDIEQIRAAAKSDLAQGLETPDSLVERYVHNGVNPWDVDPKLVHIYVTGIAARKYGIDRHILAGVIGHESNWNPAAVSPSVKGQRAYGLAQFQKPTAAKYGFDPSDPTTSVKAIDAAAHMLSDLARKHKGDVYAALKDYSGGSAWKSDERFRQKYYNDVMRRAQTGRDFYQQHQHTQAQTRLDAPNLQHYAKLIKDRGAEWFINTNKDVFPPKLMLDAQRAAGISPQQAASNLREYGGLSLFGKMEETIGGASGAFTSKGSNAFEDTEPEAPLHDGGAALSPIDEGILQPLRPESPQVRHALQSGDLPDEGPLSGERESARQFGAQVVEPAAEQVVTLFALGPAGGAADAAMEETLGRLLVERFGPELPGAVQVAGRATARFAGGTALGTGYGLAEGESPGEAIKGGVLWGGLDALTGLGEKEPFGPHVDSSRVRAYALRRTWEQGGEAPDVSGGGLTGEVGGEGVMLSHSESQRLRALRARESEINDEIQRNYPRKSDDPSTQRLKLSERTRLQRVRDSIRKERERLLSQAQVRVSPLDRAPVDTQHPSNTAPEAAPQAPVQTFLPAPTRPLPPPSTESEAAFQEIADERRTRSGDEVSDTPTYKSAGSLVRASKLNVGELRKLLPQLANEGYNTSRLSELLDEYEKVSGGNRPWYLPRTTRPNDNAAIGLWHFINHEYDRMEWARSVADERPMDELDELDGVAEDRKDSLLAETPIGEKDGKAPIVVDSPSDGRYYWKRSEVERLASHPQLRQFAKSIERVYPKLAQFIRETLSNDPVLSHILRGSRSLEEEEQMPIFGGVTTSPGSYGINVFPEVPMDFEHGDAQSALFINPSIMLWDNLADDLKAGRNSLTNTEDHALVTLVHETLHQWIRGREDFDPIVDRLVDELSKNQELDDEVRAAIREGFGGDTPREVLGKWRQHLGEYSVGVRRYANRTGENVYEYSRFGKKRAEAYGIGEGMDATGAVQGGGGETPHAEGNSPQPTSGRTELAGGVSEGVVADEMARTTSERGGDRPDEESSAKRLLTREHADVIRNYAVALLRATKGKFTRGKLAEEVRLMTKGKLNLPDLNDAQVHSIWANANARYRGWEEEPYPVAKSAKPPQAKATVSSQPTAPKAEVPKPAEPPPTKATAPKTKRVKAAAPDAPAPEAAAASAVAGKRITGLALKYTEVERVLQGLPGRAIEATRQAMNATWEMGRNSGIDPRGLVKSLIDNPKRSVNEQEMATLGAHLIGIKNEMYDLTRQIAENPKGRSVNNLADRMSVLRQDFADATQAIQTAGTTTGRTLQFFKALMDEDYSFIGCMGRAIAERVKAGRPASDALSSQEEAALKSAHDNYTQAYNGFQNSYRAHQMGIGAGLEGPGDDFYKAYANLPAKLSNMAPEKVLAELSSKSSDELEPEEEDFLNKYQAYKDAWEQFYDPAHPPKMDYNLIEAYSDGLRAKAELDHAIIPARRETLPWRIAQMQRNAVLLSSNVAAKIGAGQIISMPFEQASDWLGLLFGKALDASGLGKFDGGTLTEFDPRQAKSAGILFKSHLEAWKTLLSPREQAKFILKGLTTGASDADWLANEFRMYSAVESRGMSPKSAARYLDRGRARFLDRTHVAGSPVKQTLSTNRIIQALHGSPRDALKSAYMRSAALKMLEGARKMGMPVESPDFQIMTAMQAAAEAEQRVMMNPNLAADVFKDTLSNLNRKGYGGQIAAAFIKTFEPVVQLPLNYLGREIQTSGEGLVEGLGRAIGAKRRFKKQGILPTPEQATKIHDALRYGGQVGWAILGLTGIHGVVKFAGNYNSEGIYNHDSHGKPMEPGTAEIMGHRVNATIVDSYPGFRVASNFATMRALTRYNMRKYGKGWGEVDTLLTPAEETAGQVPGSVTFQMLQQSREKTGLAGEPAEYASSYVPAISRNIARFKDVPEEDKPLLSHLKRSTLGAVGIGEAPPQPISRSPQTPLQVITQNIPDIPHVSKEFTRGGVRRTKKHRSIYWNTGG